MKMHLALSYKLLGHLFKVDRRTATGVFLATSVCFFGISNHDDASALVALGLHALQHRGQEGCGIVSFDGKKYYSEKRFGLVGDNFNKEKVLNNLKGSYAIGHNRYSTTGNNTLRNIQPFFADTNAGGIGVAHNGNLTNSIALRNKLVEEGAIFYTTSDTETIVQLIAHPSGSGHISYTSRSVQFAPNDVIHHSASVANPETSRLDTSNGCGSNNDNSKIRGFFVQGPCHVLRDAFGNDGNGSELAKIQSFVGHVIS